MPPNRKKSTPPRYNTLKSVFTRARKKRAFLNALMKNPAKALAKEKLSLSLEDMKKLNKIIVQAKRIPFVEIKKLLKMGLDYGLVSIGTEPLPPPGGPIGPNPPWPWPGDWVDFLSGDFRDEILIELGYTGDAIRGGATNPRGGRIR